MKAKRDPETIVPWWAWALLFILFSVEWYLYPSDPVSLHVEFCSTNQEKQQ